MSGTAKPARGPPSRPDRRAGDGQSRRTGCRRNPDAAGFDWTVDRLGRGLLWTAFRLPYERRVPMMGAAFRALGGLTGYRARAETQLDYIFPDMPASERRRIARAVLDNFGRVLIENYSTADQLARARRWQPHGPGLGRPPPARRRGPRGGRSCFVSGHYGNYQAARAAMNVRGYQMGGLYRLNEQPIFQRPVCRLGRGCGRAGVRARPAAGWWALSALLRERRPGRDPDRPVLGQWRCRSSSWASPRPRCCRRPRWR